ncbi:MAG TPA: hypothetical protein VIV12_24170 [Streptosporangiaceae bacterium]
MLTVAGDRDLVERQLAGGLLACPECGTGVLGGHGWVPSRWLRRADGRVVLLKAHATDQEKASGAVADGLRRARCKVCGVTHVLAPPQVLFRRLDETSVIGEVLATRAGGAGYRAIAGLLGRAAAGTVGLAAELGVIRRCVTRFTVNAGRLRAAFTALVHQVDASPPVMTSGRAAVAEAVAAIGEAAAAVRRLLGTRMAAVSPWEVAAAVSHGRLLAVSPPARLFSTSGHLEPAM